jgi:hypothetical protein
VRRCTPPPAALRDRILDAASLLTAARAKAYQFTATDRFPQIVKGVRKMAAWVAPTAAASLMLVEATISFVWLDSSDERGRIASSALDRVIEEPIESTAAVAKNPVPQSTTPETATTGPAGSTGPKATTIAVAATAPVVTPQPTNTSATTAAPVPATTSGPAIQETTQPAPTATTVPPTAGRLSVGSGSLDLGAGSGTSSGTVAVSNLGDLPVNFTVGGAPDLF